MQVERILIFTMKKDLRLTRICVASIRMFYPDIRIDLVKDESKGPFSTRDLELYWNCGVEKFGQDRLGGSGMLIKLQPLSGLRNSVTLLLDNDTVFAGQVFERLNDVDADFVVTHDVVHGDLTTEYGRRIVKAFLFDEKALAEIEPSFQFAGKMFNAGHMIIRPSAIPAKAVAKFLQFTPVRFVEQGIFQQGDAGFWNFLLQWLNQQGLAKLEYVPFAVYPNQLDCDLMQSAIGGVEWPGKIVHWAGEHSKGRLKDMRNGQILSFFERHYYGRVPFGACRRQFAAFKFWGRYWLSRVFRLCVKLKSALRSVKATSRGD